jgi:hypothetical protein
MRSRFFPLTSAADVKDRYFLIASEFGFDPSDEMPLYRFQQYSEYAQKRRDERIDAARNGMIYTG